MKRIKRIVALAGIFAALSSLTVFTAACGYREIAGEYHARSGVQLFVLTLTAGGNFTIYREIGPLNERVDGGSFTAEGDTITFNFPGAGGGSIIGTILENGNLSFSFQGLSLWVRQE